jgi:hypothetical protein
MPQTHASDRTALGKNKSPREPNLMTLAFYRVSERRKTQNLHVYVFAYNSVQNLHAYVFADNSVQNLHVYVSANSSVWATHTFLCG